MTASALQLLGMAVACGGAALALLARDPRLRYGAALAALIAAPILVGGDVWHSARFVHLRHHPVTLAAAIAVTLAAVGAGAVMFRRYPWTLPVSLFAALRCACRSRSRGRRRTC